MPPASVSRTLASPKGRASAAGSPAATVTQTKVNLAQEASVAGPRLVLTHATVPEPHEHVIVRPLVEQHILEPFWGGVELVCNGRVVGVDVCDDATQCLLAAQCIGDGRRVGPQRLAHVVAVGEVPRKDYGQGRCSARRHAGARCKCALRGALSSWCIRKAAVGRECVVKRGNAVRHAD
eukprot:5432900-Prymnesium_polylepis.1